MDESFGDSEIYRTMLGLQIKSFVDNELPRKAEMGEEFQFKNSRYIFCGYGKLRGWMPAYEFESNYYQLLPEIEDSSVNDRFIDPYDREWVFLSFGSGKSKWMPMDIVMEVLKNNDTTLEQFIKI